MQIAGGGGAVFRSSDDDIVGNAGAVKTERCGFADLK